MDVSADSDDDHTQGTEGEAATSLHLSIQPAIIYKDECCDGRHPESLIFQPVRCQKCSVALT